MTDVVDLALACYRRPLDYQDRFSLAAPLPEGMDRLLWLANGSPEVLEAGIRQTGAKPQELRDAARFCIQQWCLVRGADPHRVLGVEAGAPPEQIKEHYRLLMRLFHPDRAAGRETWTDHYASRINEAWTALSRMPDRAIADSQPTPCSVPIQDTVRSTVERAVEPPGPFSSRHQLERRLRARRRWLPQLVWGGLMLAVMAVLGGFYLDRFSVSRSGFEPTGIVGSAPPSGLAMVPEPVADPGALGPLLAAPDWQALEQREQQAQQQIVRAREERKQWEDNRRQQIAAEEALLEKMRVERARLEEQVKIEQARMERARAERLAVEQQRLARLQAEQARIEQVRTERELAERRRLEALQAEQARAEHLAEELRIERQRLEKLKAEQAQSEQHRAEQARIEQTNMERVQAERRRLEEQSKAERAPAEQERAERTRQEVTPVAVVAAPEKRDLTARELESLMSRYTRAYQQGDLGSVMALFATGARSRIREDYATLFATHHIRGLWLQDLRWVYRGQSASGSGRYELRLQRRDNGEPHQVRGGIRFTVQKRDNQVLIEAIEYDWPES